MTSKDWEICKLGNIIELIGGGTPKTSIPEYWNGNIPWISVKDFNNNNKKVYVTEKTITELGLNKSATKLLQKGDIIISARGTVGEIAVISRPMAFNQSCYGIKAIPNIVQDDFLYYLLKNSIQYLKHNTHGSVFDTITKETFEKIDILLPPLETQEKIARVLSSLDDKIELNNKINQNLEQQAQAIFKSWFVDFEPFGGKMPEDWKVGNLYEIANVTMGQSPDGKSYNENGYGEVFYQGRAEFGSRYPTRRLYTTEPKRMANAGDILMSVRAPVGDINVALEKCCIGRGLASISSRDNFNSFILYTLMNLKRSFDIYNAEGTVFGAINKDSLNSIEVIIPTKERIYRFEEIASNLDKMIRLNTIEIQNLQKLRDILLPKLMSGEIDVDKVEV